MADVAEKPARDVSFKRLLLDGLQVGLQLGDVIEAAKRVAGGGHERLERGVELGDGPAAPLVLPREPAVVEMLAVVEELVVGAVGADDLDRAAGEIVQEALRCGSDDNVTVQIVRIDETPQFRSDEAAARSAACRFSSVPISVPCVPYRRKASSVKAWHQPSRAPSSATRLACREFTGYCPGRRSGRP